jgi:spore coat polysaccharide biosynthesis predicted glycosyltransferase SpsG
LSLLWRFKEEQTKTARVRLNKIYESILTNADETKRLSDIINSPIAEGISIDDLADRRHECDLLLDHNFYNDQDFRYQSKVSPNCQLLLGPRYALLRNEFGELHNRTQVRVGVVSSESDAEFIS